MYDPYTNKLLLERVEKKLAELRKAYKDPNEPRSKTSIVMEAKPLTALKKRLLANQIAT